MKSRGVIEIVAENYEEEQFLLTKFPRTIWIKMGEDCRFYVSNDQLSKVAEVLAEWKGVKK